MAFSEKYNTAEQWLIAAAKLPEGYIKVNPAHAQAILDHVRDLEHGRVVLHTVLVQIQEAVNEKGDSDYLRDHILTILKGAGL